MKSYVQVFSELYHALAEDVCAQYPTIKSEMDRDISRLQLALSSEGLSFITISHLAMCDFFQKSLAAETLVHDLPTMSRPRGFGRKSSKDQRPNYLWGLLAKVFAEDGKLLHDPDVNAIAFVRQWLLMAKKLEIDCDEKRKEASLTEFLAIEARMPDHHSGTWDLDDPLWTRRTGHPLWGRPNPSLSHPDLFKGLEEEEVIVDWDLYRQLCDRIRSMIGTFDPWSARPKHGPGAVADKGNPMKYDFTNWPRKLQQYFPWDYHATHDFGTTLKELDRCPSEAEYPSIIVCVPKTQKGPRIICKEPIAHQWMQGAIQRFLEGRVRDLPLGQSINFKDQDLSKVMAQEASFDGSSSTVDLSAASDRISTRLVEYLFGGSSDSSLLDALHASRSRYYSLNEGFYRFRKFAPMGSACTFPVQSILFLSFAILAVMQTRRLPLQDWLNVLPEIRVFGDDIILPTDSIPVLYSALSTCGLKVNTSKSYTTGLFRESCGGDYYAGWDVTPAYVRRTYSSSNPSSLKSVVDVANNLFEKGYWCTADVLLKTVPHAERKLLAVHGITRNGSSQGDGAVSLSSFCGSDRSHLSSRFNDHLHKTEHAAILVSTKTTKRHSDGAAGLIQFFSEEPDPATQYESGQVLRTTGRKTRGWV